MPSGAEVIYGALKLMHFHTVIVLRIAHSIWKETMQEPGTAGPGIMLGCCLVSFHFLWAILSTSNVQGEWLRATGSWCSVHFSSCLNISLAPLCYMEKWECETLQIPSPLRSLRIISHETRTGAIFHGVMPSIAISDWLTDWLDGWRHFHEISWSLSETESS